MRVTQESMQLMPSASKGAVAPTADSETPCSSPSSKASDFSFAPPFPATEAKDTPIKDAATKNTAGRNNAAKDTQVNGAPAKDTPPLASGPMPTTPIYSSLGSTYTTPRPLGVQNTAGPSHAPGNARLSCNQNTPSAMPLAASAPCFYPYGTNLPPYPQTAVPEQPLPPNLTPGPSAPGQPLPLPPYMTPGQVPLPYTPRPGQYAPPGMLTPMPDAFTSKPLHYYGFPSQPMSPYHVMLTPTVIPYHCINCGEDCGTPSPNSSQTVHSSVSGYSSANMRTPQSSAERSVYTPPYTRNSADTTPSTGGRSRARSFRSQESFWPSRSGGVSLADATNTWTRKEPLQTSPSEEDQPSGKMSIRRLTSWCFKAHSKGVPANLPKVAVKNLVKHQLKAHEPTVAPWYRQKPKTEMGSMESELEEAEIVDKENSFSGTGVYLPRA